jgi:hypothetical protein
MVKHIVSFRLNGTPQERKELANKFKDALLALPTQIDELISMEVGVNENPAETWYLVLIATAASLEDVQIYSKHPAHVAAVSIIAQHKADRACVDYTF